MKNKIKPSDFVQRFLNIMAINHDVKVLVSIRIEIYKICNIYTLVDKFAYKFNMKDGDNLLIIKR